jgi:hypothetical protein
MTVQLVGVMHLRELQVMRNFVRQFLEGGREGGFAALSQAYDGDFDILHAVFCLLKFCDCKITAFCGHLQSLFMGILGKSYTFVLRR